MKYTLITCHFGDPFWVTNTLTRVDKLSDSRLADVVIVDQDRSSGGWLSSLPRVSRVVEFDADAGQVALLGHDHPASLNRALQVLDISTSHILILDSDCFPLHSRWLDDLTEVTVASDPHYWSLTHPCLIAFPSQARAVVDFAEGIAETGIDTGRLVGLQLAKAGYPVNFTRPSPAFRGYRGHFYLDGGMYHHGSASFASSNDERLTRQVDAGRELIFRRHVERNEFDFSRAEFLFMRSRGAARRVKESLVH